MKDGEVLISFVIPMWNRENTICYCLDSILCQSLACSFEIIIVDDASIDKSNFIVSDISTINADTCRPLKQSVYANEMPETIRLFKSLSLDKELQIRSRIKLITLHLHQGAAVARNIGIENSIGKYLWFVDSDDFIANRSLSIIKESVSNQTIDILRFSKVNFNSNSPSAAYVLNEYINKPKLKYINGINDLMYILQYGSVWNALFNREFVKDSRFSSNFSYSEDSLFSWQVTLRAQKIAYLDAPLYAYMLTEGSLTSTKPLIRFKCYIKVVEEYIEAIKTSVLSDEVVKCLINECEWRIYCHAFYTYNYTEMTSDMWNIWYDAYYSVMVNNSLRPQYKRILSKILFTFRINALFILIFSIIRRFRAKNKFYG